MVLDDLGPVSHIEQQVTPHPWRESEFLGSFSRHHCLAATLGHRVVGYAIYQVVAGEAEILNLAIEPGSQGCGYGHQLLDHLIAIVSAQAQRLFLEVRVSNDPARQLYERAGFVEICIRKNYYQTDAGPEDAILMAMELYG